MSRMLIEMSLGIPIRPAYRNTTNDTSLTVQFAFTYDHDGLFFEQISIHSCQCFSCQFHGWECDESLSFHSSIHYTDLQTSTHKEDDGKNVISYSFATSSRSKKQPNNCNKSSSVISFGIFRRYSFALGSP